MHSLYNNLAHWAQLTPEQPFIIEAESGEVMTYQQCFMAVKAICQHLGETPKHLFLSIPNGIPNALIWLSAFVGGHTLVPLAPDASVEDRRRASTMFQPDVIFVEEQGSV